MLMGEIFTHSIKMERELVYCMDNLCRKLTSRSFQYVVPVVRNWKGVFVFEVGSCHLWPQLLGCLGQLPSLCCVFLFHSIPPRYSRAQHLDLGLVIGAIYFSRWLLFIFFPGGFLSRTFRALSFAFTLATFGNDFVSIGDDYSCPPVPIIM